MKASVPIILLSLLISCSTVPRDRADTGPLHGFFRACEADLERARRVVVERDLVKMLSHFQKMDSGGKKYYLLEREGISALIRSVTAGAYDDIVILNEGGTVIYAMNEDALFAARIAPGRGGVLGACLANRSAVPFISGVGPLAPPGGDLYLAVSAPVEGGNSMPGTIALIIGIDRIRDLIGSRFSVLDEKGRYEVAGDRGAIGTQFPDIGRIDLSQSGDGVAGRFPSSAGGSAEYRLFRYRNVRWIIIAE